MLKLKDLTNVASILGTLTAILWAVNEYSKFEYVLLIVFVLLAVFGLAIISKPKSKGSN